MIPIPVHPNYFMNRERHGDAYPCVVCGRKCHNPRWGVRVVSGGGYIGTDEDANADPGGDLGIYPIGGDCLREHPEIKPYAIAKMR